MNKKSKRYINKNSVVDYLKERHQTITSMSYEIGYDRAYTSRCLEDWKASADMIERIAKYLERDVEEITIPKYSYDKQPKADKNNIITSTYIEIANAQKLLLKDVLRWYKLMQQDDVAYNPLKTIWTPQFLDDLYVLVDLHTKEPQKHHIISTSAKDKWNERRKAGSANVDK